MFEWGGGLGAGVGGVGGVCAGRLLNRLSLLSREWIWGYEEGAFLLALYIMLLLLLSVFSCIPFDIPDVCQKKHSDRLCLCVCRYALCRPVCIDCVCMYVGMPYAGLCV